MLTDDQKETVRQWALEGAELNEIHAKIASELGITMTYFEARLLVSDLELSLNKPEEPEDQPEITDDPAPQEASPVPEGALGGDVAIEVDSVAQPNAMVSGKVTFSDGVCAAWYVDQMGRLGLDPEQEGYQPSEEDVMAFQTKLQGALKSQGF